MSELDDYDYELPGELIAVRPPPARDDARLLVVRRSAGTFEHSSIRGLPELLAPGDCLALNDTRVVPASLRGVRTETGGRWEGMFLDAPAPGVWRIIGQTRGHLRAGEQLTLHPVHSAAAGMVAALQLRLREREDGGIWRVDVLAEQDALTLLAIFGTVPLPPYLHRELATDEDRVRYQTLYARTPGAVAAPTAGLHFTPELFAACEARGINRCTVTLHVGIGTFRPIQVDRLDDHRMHAEWCEVTAAAAERLQATRARGGRVVAVGTTTVRTLETAAQDGELKAWQGPTEIFIRPPYRFLAVDVLLTNFHLPRSSLLVMLAAFAGRELVLSAYREAVAQRYRFYSYGDAMLLLP